MKTMFLSMVRAESMKSKHGAPKKLAVLMALPLPLLAIVGAVSMPDFGLSYTPWNYWYVLLMPVALTLIVATVANADARLGNQNLLSCGVSLKTAWQAKITWCLMLSLLSNLIVFAIYTVASFINPLGSAGVLKMLITALSLTVLSSWLVPAGLFLTMRFGTLPGIFVPLSLQLALSFGWSVVPFWPVVPPVATTVLPSSLLPVLPSGEPIVAGMDVAQSIGQFGMWGVIALGVGALVTVVLSLLGAEWLKRSEELR